MDAAQPYLRRPLPVFGPKHSGRAETCRWRCGFACDQPPANPSDNETFEQVLHLAVSRRALLKGASAAGLLVLVGVGGAVVARNLGGLGAEPGPVGTGTSRPDRATPDGPDGGLTFRAIEPSREDALLVPEGYDAAVVIRWGDPLLPDAPDFALEQLTADGQATRFGYNCDYVAVLSARRGGTDPAHALLVVNHEYTNPELMFAGYDADNPTAEQAAIELAAHGLSVVEIERGSGDDRSFRYRRGAPLNRRITATTPFLVAGPAVGHRLLRTGEDPDGRRVLGTLNNCAGGKTPWGTVLSGEENVHQYFAHLEAVEDEAVRAIHRRYALEDGESERKWERFHPRFDLAIEPNEPFRFGWVVEVDPYDPAWIPRKRTALGRLKHEGATTRLADDGRVAVYMGDDQPFEYLYKFVTARRFRDADLEANRDLLDEGTLYVARFDADGDDDYDGSGRWLPLVHGQGPLTEDNGFADQADVLVNTRGAADLLGATKMDRPEDVEASPVDGAVFVSLTKNEDRGTTDDDGDARPAPDAANPRPRNEAGHVIEIGEDGADAAATRFRWRILLLCGDPEDAATDFAGFDKRQVSPIACPDNLAFDGAGNQWIATDGQPGAIGWNDGLHAVSVSGAERGHVKQFLSVPVGAETCGPEFASDFATLFCAVQHPGEDGSLEEPASDWPDREGRPPRPSVVSVWRTDSGEPRIGA